MSKINTPVNQKRLTNVAVVRMKKGGQKFELACYPNKVLSWRQGVERDLDEVLQLRTIFANVGKGQPANKDALKKCFGTEDESQIITEMLEKGELQVGQKEREHQLENLAKDIATIIAQKCVDPETKLPIPVGLVERALKEAHFTVNMGKPAKVQALAAIKVLQEKKVLKLERAQLRLRIIGPKGAAAKIKAALEGEALTVLEEHFEEDWTYDCLADPGSYRNVEEVVKKLGRNKARVEMLQHEIQVEDKQLTDE